MVDNLRQRTHIVLPVDQVALQERQGRRRSFTRPIGTRCTRSDLSGLSPAIDESRQAHSDFVLDDLFFSR